MGKFFRTALNYTVFFLYPKEDNLQEEQGKGRDGLWDKSLGFFVVVVFVSPENTFLII